MAVPDVLTHPAPKASKGQLRARRATIFAQVAALHGGIAHRADLRRAGVTREDLRTEVGAGRWRLAGRYTVLPAGRELSGPARWQWAVWESGSGAALDGVTALETAGLENFDEATVHVSVPSANTTYRLADVTGHRPNDIGALLHDPVLRVVPEIACLRAAAWAASDRTAALIVAMAVQQRVVQGERLQKQWEKVGYTARREVIEQTVRGRARRCRVAR